ncbi:MAG: galactitol-1-phosphate 5-dehydrogenase [Spirochaetota bacterium]
MKSLVLKNDKLLFYEETDVPLKKERLLIRITYAGICSSDIERAFGGKAYHYPLVMGHEFCGVLEEDGARVKKGDRVAVFPVLPCRKCPACETGDYAQCADYDYYGSRCDGGFAEYAYVPEENCISIPDHVKSAHAAMTEPCAVALHGVNKCAVTPGAVGCVYGGGPIGNFAAQWLRLRGCANVIVVEIDARKRAIAESMGFLTIDPADENPVAAVERITNGRLADAVVEACGLPATFLNAVQSAGKSGTVVFLGNIRGTFAVPEEEFSKILRKELTLRGTWNSKITPTGRSDWDTVLASIDKAIDCTPLISHVVDLKDGVRMFDTIVEKKEFVNKAIFRVSKDAPEAHQ